MKTGVLCIHGFTGGPFEVEPFADFLIEQTDWLVEIPTLPGHGEKLALKSITAESWMMEAELALKRLKKSADRIIIVGFSMGGLIAMYLAMRYKIDRLVLLSAAAKYISPVQMFKEVQEAVKDAVSGKITENALFHLYEYKLTNTPISSTVEFLRVVKMVEPYYDKIKIPVCIVQGEKDGIVPVSAADFIYDHIGSEEKHLIRSEKGKHLICYSEDCEEWFSEVFTFMNKGLE
ncbi:carboxylesterase [Planococcus sp. PAMC 21323]|uniref:alpha/beta hydrolase n=1 Tax=Planococcus sp. PAMC 21323 TaxID=1526927 RepID=UPI000570812F|nr:alpha/beta fold hydrolase [Planococcus sp. PAMC 21323]AIY04393.1 carboxylesterase [Planococcus sp. PAMC 21323]